MIRVDNVQQLNEIIDRSIEDYSMSIPTISKDPDNIFCRIYASLPMIYGSMFAIKIKEKTGQGIYGLNL